MQESKKYLDRLDRLHVTGHRKKMRHCFSEIKLTVTLDGKRTDLKGKCMCDICMMGYEIKDLRDRIDNILFSHDKCSIEK